MTDRFVRQLGDNCRARSLDGAGEPRPDATGDPPAEKRIGRGRTMERQDFFWLTWMYSRVSYCRLYTSRIPEA